VCGRAARLRVDKNDGQAAQQQAAEPNHGMKPTAEVVPDLGPAMPEGCDVFAASPSKPSVTVRLPKFLSSMRKALVEGDTAQWKQGMKTLCGSRYGRGKTDWETAVPLEGSTTKATVTDLVDRLRDVCAAPIPDGERYAAAYLELCPIKVEEAKVDKAAEEEKRSSEVALGKPQAVCKASIATLEERVKVLLEQGAALSSAAGTVEGVVTINSVRDDLGAAITRYEAVASNVANQIRADASV
jgi:hypothetical protein